MAKVFHMNRFSINIGLRVILLFFTMGTSLWLYMHAVPPLALLLLPLVFLQLYNIYYYLNRINRKLTLFLESIRYEDFSIRFSADNKLGKSFSMLNHQFNEVLEAFRQTRAEKEANLKYIDTIVQHISIGVLSFDTTGKIELINPAAFRLLSIYRLRNLSELKNAHPGLEELLLELQAGTQILYATRQGQQLSIHAATVRLQGRLVKLISIQNIHAELQKKELDAWQNLTKILRHEIMNSVTPIVSLIGTMKEIVDLDIAPGATNTEGIMDLREALQTVESRSKGIMNFVNAYRDYTTLPQPLFTNVSVKTLVNSVSHLFQADLKQANIRFSLEVDAENMEIYADVSQLQMVLINLVKNAIDALEFTADAAISMRVYLNSGQQVCIEVTDNGPGIDEDAMNKIFIPFFTTKKKGSGIGLSLSQQIIQLHGGQLKVMSPGHDGNGTTFYVLLNTGA
ncbi:sensor histidine kinase [Chitinophaga nivalis]|uniref:histidine kinase n=1 Tax=Chitinophaga nivalis TaxID=2991709 RepID=A0ABT3IWL7_9BACT|nr:ATP-binding protein [Chitinophaga nivalis]MCW3462198.1 ATP-binding protein [Chitinophaga nivalis]MCW3488110.1 ATP-binding protein [Chitinophaga nivalis]